MKKIIIMIFFLLFLPFLFVMPSFAQNNTQYQKTVVLPKDKTVNEDYFAAGQQVIISGTINGDAYVAGNKVLIDGTVKGDLLVAGGTVAIAGTVAQDVRAAGGTVLVSGNVGKNMTIAGGNITVTNKAHILGSLVTAGGNIDILSPVGKNLTIGAGNVTVGNTVGGQIEAGVGQLTFTPDARIHGNITYYSNNPALIEKGASLSGTISYHPPLHPAENQQQAAKRFFSGLDAAIKLLNLLTVGVLGLLVVWVFPIFSNLSQETIRKKFGMSFLVGLITIIIIPLVSLILFLTVFGIPFAILLWIGLFLLVLMAKIIVAYAIGKLIAKYAKFELSNFLLFIIGLLAYTLISWVPVIGTLFSIIAIMSGLGAFLMQERTVYLLLRNKKLI